MSISILAFIPFVGALKGPAAAGRACEPSQQMQNLFLFKICFCSISNGFQSCRGAQKAHRAVPKEALYGVFRISSLITWTYLHSFCNTFDVNLLSHFREWRPAKPRTGKAFFQSICFHCGWVDGSTQNGDVTFWLWRW